MGKRRVKSSKRYKGVRPDTRETKDVRVDPRDSSQDERPNRNRPRQEQYHHEKRSNSRPTSENDVGSRKTHSGAKYRKGPKRPQPDHHQQARSENADKQGSTRRRVKRPQGGRREPGERTSSYRRDRSTNSGSRKSKPNYNETRNRTYNDKGRRTASQSPQNNWDIEDPQTIRERILSNYAYLIDHPAMDGDESFIDKDSLEKLLRYYGSDEFEQDYRDREEELEAEVLDDNTSKRVDEAEVWDDFQEPDYKDPLRFTVDSVKESATNIKEGVRSFADEHEYDFSTGFEGLEALFDRKLEQMYEEKFDGQLVLMKQLMEDIKQLQDLQYEFVQSQITSRWDWFKANKELSFAILLFSLVAGTYCLIPLIGSIADGVSNATKPDWLKGRTIKSTDLIFQTPKNGKCEVTGLIGDRPNDLYSSGISMTCEKMPAQIFAPDKGIVKKFSGNLTSITTTLSPEEEIDNIAVGEMIGGYYVTSPWDPNRPHPVLRNADGTPVVRPHRGVDVGTPIGIPIVVPEGLTVTVTCGVQDGYGNVAMVVYDAGAVFAAHLSSCTDGEFTEGEEFALTGNTGIGSGPHLHFEERTNATDKYTAFPPRREVVTAFMTGSPITLSSQLTLNTEDSPLYIDRTDAVIIVDSRYAIVLGNADKVKSGSYGNNDLVGYFGPKDQEASDTYFDIAIAEIEEDGSLDYMAVTTGLVQSLMGMEILPDNYTTDNKDGHIWLESGEVELQNKNVPPDNVMKLEEQICKAAESADFENPVSITISGMTDNDGTMGAIQYAMDLMSEVGVSLNFNDDGNVKIDVVEDSTIDAGLHVLGSSQYKVNLHRMDSRMKKMVVLKAVAVAVTGCTSFGPEDSVFSSGYSERMSQNDKDLFRWYSKD